MKILVLVNWKIRRCDDIPNDLQAPDYYTEKEKYWFFKYFPKNTQIDVIDISSFKFWEKIEKNKLHFYIIQAIKAISRARKYDIIISHGMPSGIVLALFRRFFKTKAKHIVFDIGSFNSAAETGMILKLNQFASKSIDGIIYHSSEQIEYYKKFYPWLIKKCKFIPFGTDMKYFDKDKINKIKIEDYILAVGSSMRDYETLIKAFEKIEGKMKLKIIGTTNIKVKDKRVELVDRIPKRKLNIEIQKAKFCVLPLEYKNFSFGQMTLLQQMYYEKTVITAKVPSMKDYIEDGKTGILYEPKNINELTEKINLLIKDDELRSKIGKNAKVEVEQNFNEQNMAKDTYEFIKEIMKEDLVK